MRWYSAERRFPASVWIPASGRPYNPLSSQDLLITASGYRYDFNNPKDLLLEVFGYFSLSRFDLDTAGYGGDIWGFIEQELNHLRATKDIMAEQGLGWFKAIDRLQMKGVVVGEGKEALRAPRLHLRDKRGEKWGSGFSFPVRPIRATPVGCSHEALNAAMRGRGWRFLPLFAGWTSGFSTSWRKSFLDFLFCEKAESND
jgi:hypothetical protein